MSSITLELPDALATETNEFVNEGIFKSQNDVIIAALADFTRHYRPVLMDQFAREDIAWAKTLKKDKCN